MNFRIAAAREMVAGLNIRSALDVGCRDGAARDILAADVEYFGCDLFQNPAGTVAYVGDIMSRTLDRRFDCSLGRYRRHAPAGALSNIVYRDSS
jgi:hypothetical protein